LARRWGFIAGGPPIKHEADHFIRCQDSGGWFDCRDFMAVVAHIGALPHPRTKPQ
jgi:hypothetical protein